MFPSPSMMSHLSQIIDGNGYVSPTHFEDSSLGGLDVNPPTIQYLSSGTFKESRLYGHLATRTLLTTITLSTCLLYCGTLEKGAKRKAHQECTQDIVAQLDTLLVLLAQHPRQGAH